MDIQQSDQSFPLFRKSSNAKSFYKIESLNKLEELQIIGNKYIIHNLNAALYPEKLFIHELIQNIDGRYIEISSNDFDSMLQYCQTDLKPI